MEAQSYFKTTCAHCGGRIEAPAEGMGMWIRCPHCGEKTQLGEIPSATATPQNKSRALIWIVLCAVVLIGAAGGVFLFRQSPAQTSTPAQAQTAAKAETPKPAPAPEPDLWKGLKPGKVTLEQTPKSRLVYATVTVRNDTDTQRYGVKVTFDIFDSNGEKLGSTSDYQQFIDAHKEWTFKAIVAFPKAVSAKVASITEE